MGEKKEPLSLREIERRYVPLAREYLAANPDVSISEKTLVREMNTWWRRQEKFAAQERLQPTLL
ncbi:hypothetical protein [Ktedonobacter robiniae]|uniref:Integrase n=1 Tax=Ktedonobacter robiniae TaxID=2778365 RepID=A0ABQ3V7B3_9CHLR|nr:hypothetical protein [Ktedonobacter robiniae]GHO60832.1 hypothetical protein KSB_93070 [Ktedonobacter robiniae]